MSVLCFYLQFWLHGQGVSSPKKCNHASMLWVEQCHRAFMYIIAWIMRDNLSLTPSLWFTIALCCSTIRRTSSSFLFRTALKNSSTVLLSGTSSFALMPSLSHLLVLLACRWLELYLSFWFWLSCLRLSPNHFHKLILHNQSATSTARVTHTLSQRCAYLLEPFSCCYY